MGSQGDLTEDEVLGRSNDMFYRMLIGDVMTLLKVLSHILTHSE